MAEFMNQKELFTCKYEIRQKKAKRSQKYIERQREMRNITQEEKDQKKKDKLEHQIKRKNEERAMRKLCPAERKAFQKIGSR